jgi:HSP20 family molecular chaperone IbpA
MRDFGFDEMTRLWDELSRSGTGLRGRGAPADSGWAPAVDIHEREGTLVLDLPGMRRDEIALEVEANGIVIEGQLSGWRVGDHSAEGGHLRPATCEDRRRLMGV